MKFKDQKCQDWLISLFISISVNVLVTETLQFLFINYLNCHDHDYLVDEHIFLAANSKKVSIIFENNNSFVFVQVAIALRKAIARTSLGYFNFYIH